MLDVSKKHDLGWEDREKRNSDDAEPYYHSYS